MASNTRRPLNIYDREPQRKCHFVELDIDRKIKLKNRQLAYKDIIGKKHRS